MSDGQENKGIPGKDRLTPKQQRFVAALATGQHTAKAALVAAGYKPSTDANARDMANELLNLPKVQNSLQAAIKDQFPDVEQKAASVLLQGLDDPELRIESKIKIIELLSKVFGWQAPSKHASLNVSLTGNKLKLPGEDDV